MAVAKVEQAYDWVIEELRKTRANKVYLGKVVRWFYGTSGTGTINYKTSGNKVPRSDGATPLMDIPLDFPSNVDYTWYENEVNELLMDIGLVKRPPVVKKTRSKKI